MNAFVGSGREVRNAVVRSDKVKLIKFTIVAKYGYDREKKRDRVSFIPCVLFNPTEALENLLAREGKGVFVEFEGRVSTVNCKAKLTPLRVIL